MPILEGHHTITNHNTLEIDSLGACILVVLVNPNSQIGDVLPSIGLTSNPERILQVLPILGEEIQQSIDIVLCCGSISMHEGFIMIIRVSDTCGRLEK